MMQTDVTNQRIFCTYPWVITGVNLIESAIKLEPSILHSQKPEDEKNT